MQSPLRFSTLLYAPAKVKDTQLELVGKTKASGRDDALAWAIREAVRRNIVSSTHATYPTTKKRPPHETTTEGRPVPIQTESLAELTIYAPSMSQVNNKNY